MRIKRESLLVHTRQLTQARRLRVPPDCPSCSVLLFSLCWSHLVNGGLGRAKCEASLARIRAPSDLSLAARAVALSTTSSAAPFIFCPADMEVEAEKFLVDSRARCSSVVPFACRTGRPGLGPFFVFSGPLSRGNCGAMQRSGAGSSRFKGSDMWSGEMIISSAQAPCFQISANFSNRRRRCRCRVTGTAALHHCSSLVIKT